MEVLDTNRFIIDGFEYLGFDVQYTFCNQNNINPISLSLELNYSDINYETKNKITQYGLEQYG